MPLRKLSFLALWRPSPVRPPIPGQKPQLQLRKQNEYAASFFFLSCARLLRLGNDTLQHHECSLDPRPVHITVCNEPHRMQRRILRPHSIGMKRIAQLHGGFPGLRAIKNNDVRSNLLRIDRQPRDCGDAFRQPLGIFLIDVQPRWRLFQCNQSRRGDHARLPHASAEHFPVDAPLFDERLRPRDHRSNRSAQSLGQTEHHRIHFLRHLCNVIAERCRGIKNPSTIQMHFQTRAMRVVADVRNLRRRIDRSSCHIARVFQAHQRGLRIVINLRPDDRLDLFPRQNPVLPPCHSGHAACNRGHRRQLIQIYVAALFTDHFIPMVRPDLDRNQVPHASRRNKQRRFFPKNLRRAPLQSVDRRVFPVYVVANLRLRHRPPHLRRRPRHRIAPQVHHSRRNLPRLRNLIRIHSLIPLCNCVAHVPLFSVNSVLSAPSVLTLFLPLLSAFLRELSVSALSFFFLSFFPSALLYLRSSTNTSFETLSLSGASRTMLPSRSTKPADANGSNRSVSV